MADTILIVEDDLNYRSRTARYLGELQFDVIEASDIQEARRCLVEYPIDLVIIGIGLGQPSAFQEKQSDDSGSSGFELLNFVRARENYTAVIVVTSLGEPIYETICLNRGADDFLIKHGDKDVLAARIRCNLRLTRLMRRRAHIPKPGTYPVERFGTPVLNAGVFRLDANRMLQVRDSDLIPLSDHEFSLLSLMAQKPGKVFLHTELFEHLGGPDIALRDKYIDYVASTLRRKIARLGGKGLMKRVWRVGHQLSVSFSEVEPLYGNRQDSHLRAVESSNKREAQLNTTARPV